MLGNFLNPKSIAVVGDFEDSTQFGYLLLKNILSAKFVGKIYAINSQLKYRVLYGCVKSFGSIKEIEESVDIVAITVSSNEVLNIINDCICNKTKNIIITSSGFGEIGNNKLEQQILQKCKKNKINILGPNSLGYISTKNNLNISFASTMPLKGQVAFVSQSGAYFSSILDWAKLKNIGFSYVFSIGNKIDITEMELLQVLEQDRNTTSIVFYLESLKNGQKFLHLARKVVKTKPIIVLEPGKSSKARIASLSHTGSLAPNHRVLEIAYLKAGVIQARNTRELFGLLEILQYANHKQFEEKICIITNAGGLGVLASDLCEDNGLDISQPSNKTITKLKKILPVENSFKNPIDIGGDAKSDRYEMALEIVCSSQEYKNIFVFLTPQIMTDIESVAEIIIKISRKYKNINIFSVFIGGEKTSRGKRILQSNKMLYYKYPSDIITLFGLLQKYKIYKGQKNIKVGIVKIPHSIKKEISVAVKNNLKSLPQTTVEKIMKLFEIDYPISGSFLDKNKALDFCKKIFPNKVVLKLSSPNTIHKTDVKGIYLNVNDVEAFNSAWDNLQKIIEKQNIVDATILIQEMIENSTEVIVGVNYDDNFGNVMVFGTGGIYAEIMNDISLRILPTMEFKDMIYETKVSKILDGARGEKVKSVDKLIDTMIKIQKMVLSIKEIKSIDANPILVNENRAIIVDFKILL